MNRATEHDIDPALWADLERQLADRLARDPEEAIEAIYDGRGIMAQAHELVGKLLTCSTGGLTFQRIDKVQSLLRQHITDVVKTKKQEEVAAMYWAELDSREREWKADEAGARFDARVERFGHPW
jgi:hypothetical protein